MTAKGKIVATILIVAGVLPLAWALRKTVHTIEGNQTINVRTVPPSASFDLTASETMTALAHPIKAGGVHSVTELLRLMNSDSAVAVHYRAEGFRAECASTMILATNTFARTSYRTATGFAWTRTPILILAGTDLIVDCEGHLIKMNCANLLELVGKTEEMPAGGLMGALIPPPDDLPFPLPPTDVSPPVGPPIVPGSQPTPPGPPSGPPFYPVPCCLVGFAPPPGAPPVTTPEPHTALLLISGWTCGLVIYRVIRGRNLGRKS